MKIGPVVMSVVGLAMAIIFFRIPEAGHVTLPNPWSLLCFAAGAILGLGAKSLSARFAAWGRPSTESFFTILVLVAVLLIAGGFSLAFTASGMPLSDGWASAAQWGVLALCILGGAAALVSVVARFRPVPFIIPARWLRKRLGSREVPGLPPWLAAAALAAGFSLGTIFYALQIAATQNELLSKIKSANVLERALKETAFYPLFGENLHDVDMLAFSVFLERLGLVRGDVSAADLFGDESSYKRVLNAFKSPPAAACGQAPRVDRQTPTVETIVRVAQQYGCAQDGRGSPSDSNTIAGLLARRDGIWSDTDSTFQGSGSSGRLALFGRPDQVSDRRLLHALYYKVGAYGEKTELRTALAAHLSQRLTPGAKPPAEPIPADIRPALEFQLALLGEIQRDPAVITARSEVDFWLGYEQFAIVVLAFILAALTAARWLYAFPTFVMSWDTYVKLEDSAHRLNSKKNVTADDRRQELERLQLVITNRHSSTIGAGNSTRWPEGLPGPMWILDGAIDDLRSVPGSTGKLMARVGDQIRALGESRMGLKYAYSALPALGFLGTVHGILAALGNSGAITSTDRLEQAAGISLVSSSLGLAFATTLLALAAALLLGLFDMLQDRSERQAILELGRKLHLEFLS